MLLLICNAAAMEALPIFLYSLITAWGAILISVTLILLFGETGKGGELTHDETTILGRNNRGLFGGASGLMGLGRSDLSLVSQTSGLFGGVFSYCLPSTDDQASGSLILGGNSLVYKNSTPILIQLMTAYQLQPLNVF